MPATTIKTELFNAEFNNTALPASASDDLSQCNAILADAAALVGNPGTGTPEAPLSVLLPVSAGIIGGLFFVVRRRRTLRSAISAA